MRLFVAIMFGTLLGSRPGPGATNDLIALVRVCTEKRAAAPFPRDRFTALYSSKAEVIFRGVKVSLSDAAQLERVLEFSPTRDLPKAERHAKIREILASGGVDGLLNLQVYQLIHEKRARLTLSASKDLFIAATYASGLWTRSEGEPQIQLVAEFAVSSNFPLADRGGIAEVGLVVPPDPAVVRWLLVVNGPEGRRFFQVNDRKALAEAAATWASAKRGEPYAIPTPEELSLLIRSAAVQNMPHLEKLDAVFRLNTEYTLGLFRLLESPGSPGVTQSVLNGLEETRRSLGAVRGIGPPYETQLGVYLTDTLTQARSLLARSSVAQSERGRIEQALAVLEKELRSFPK